MAHKGATASAWVAHTSREMAESREARRSNESEEWEYKKRRHSSHSGTEAQPAASETESPPPTEEGRDSPANVTFDLWHSTLATAARVVQ